MSSLRIQRVRELLKREIGEAIHRVITLDEAGLLTVNEVSVSNDLHSANVFIGVVGSDEQRRQALTLLRRERKRIQAMIAKSVVLKYTPHLRFVLDNSIERGNRVLSIIEEMERTQPPS